jgi:hypothetical protein
VTQRLSTIVICPWCGWRAKLTADDALEIATFLRERLDEHVKELHLERVEQQKEKKPL